jgi:hypothetical protein
MVLRRTFKVSFLPIAWLLLVMALTAQETYASASAPSYAGTAVVDNSSFDWTVSLPAASAVGGNYQYAFVDYAGTGNYSGAPSGWSQVCVAMGAASIAVFEHLNGASEPASNSWGIGGTSGGVYAMAIGAVSNSAGVDGSICDAPGTGAATITTGTPSIGSSGASDFTASWATVSGTAGSLTFSGPGSFAIWAPGASAAEGYYYTGVPVAVTYTNGSGTPDFSPLAAQIAFLPLGATPTPTASPSATASSDSTPSPSPSPTTAATPTASPAPTPTSSSSPSPVPTTSAPTSASAAGITFIGRTENSTSSANASVTVSAPAGIQPGDSFVVTVSGYQSYPSNTPSGLTWLGRVQDVRQYGPDYLSAYEGVYSAGGPASFTFSGVNYPKAILRAYRGVQAVDEKAFSSTNASAKSLSLPALPGTSAANDRYVGFYTTDTQPPICPADLGDGTTDGGLWQNCDGDKVIPNQGTAPGPETASSASSTDWIGFDIDLISLPPGTSAPTPIPSGLQPIGNPPLPPGTTHWVLTSDSEFNTASNLNTSLWNGGGGVNTGTDVFCPDAFATEGGKDGLGYGATCPAQYYGTLGTAPYATLNPGVGAQIQAEPTSGGVSYYWAQLQTLNNFAQQYGYWEVSIQEPHDNSGEGDGAHPDVFLSPPCRLGWGYGVGGTPGPDYCESEVDIAENWLSTQSCAKDQVHQGVFDNETSVLSSVAPVNSVGDLSADFHAYGAQWVPPGANSNTGTYGSWQFFFDGSATSSISGVNDSSWSEGVFVMLWEDFFPSGSSPFWCGTPADSSTTGNDPLVIKYVRIWQAE